MKTTMLSMLTPSKKNAAAAATLFHPCLPPRTSFDGAQQPGRSQRSSLASQATLPFPGLLRAALTCASPPPPPTTTTRPPRPAAAPTATTISNNHHHACGPIRTRPLRLRRFACACLGLRRCSGSRVLRGSSRRDVILVRGAGATHTVVSLSSWSRRRRRRQGHCLRCASPGPRANRRAFGTLARRS